MHDSFIDLSHAQPITETPHKHLPAWLKWIGIAILLLLSFAATAYYFMFYVKQKPSAAYDPVPHSTKLNTFAQLTPTGIPPQTEVIGFLPYWAVGNKSKVRVDSMTQIIYFGLNVNEKGEILKTNDDGKNLNEWTQFKSPYFQEIRKEASASGTQVLVALKNFEGVRINQLISNPQAINTFIRQSDQLIEEHDLDGINIDFEYFTYSDFPTMKYLNPFLEKYVTELKKKHPHIIISFDVNASVVIQDNAYDMVKIGEVVDQVLLMAYDYHRPVSTNAGPISPLDAPEGKHSVKRSLQHMYGRVPQEKIIIAIPFYGTEWQTVSSEYGSKTIPNTGAIATYERIQTLLENRKDLAVKWDKTAQSPWIVYRHNGLIKQIYYEDNRSIAKKIELIKEKKLGGVAVWALGYEGDYEQPWIELNTLRQNNK